MLALYVESELSYDRHFENHEQIYRIADRVTDSSGNVTRRAVTAKDLPLAWARDYAEVQEVVRFAPLAIGVESLVTYENNSLYWESVLFASANVFDVFSHTIIAGDPETALVNPNAIAMSESMAQAYFPDGDAMGKVLELDTGLFTVALIFADLPRNTHLKYDALLPMEFRDAQTADDSAFWRWLGFSGYAYVVVPEPLPAGRDVEIGREIFNRYMAQEAARMNIERVSYLEPLTDIHLRSVTELDRPRGSMVYIIAFSAIGLVLLIVAAINYVNLATARATKRAREVGIRRVLGVARPQLIMQFLAESLVLVFAATIIGAALAYFCLNFTPINQLLGGGLMLSLIERPELLVSLIIFVITVGIGAGLYPAFYLSSIGPLAALQSNTRSGSGGKGGAFRQLLVFFQFAVSVGVIACALLMTVQMQFVYNQPLGFEKENVILVSLRGAPLTRQTAVIENQLRQDGRIISVGSTRSVPGVSLPLFLSLNAEENDGTLRSLAMAQIVADADYLDHLGVEIVAGRGFDASSFSVENRQVLVNEAFVEAMGWEQPIGKVIEQPNGASQRTVVGVARNFNFETLHEPVRPMFVLSLFPEAMPQDNAPGYSNTLSIRVSPTDIPGALAFIGQTVNEFDPDHPFEYAFYEQRLEEQYGAETSQMQLVGLFSVVCIFLSALGLYGLSAFSTAQRAREIGIRRVLGATTGSVIFMLFQSTLKIVLIASIVASLASFMIINDWLSQFALRSDINPLIFVFATGVCLAIALGTIALQSYGSIRANPVDSLGAE